MSDPVLEIRDLSVSYHTDRGTLQALREVCIEIPVGKIVGIVGESGCGKSTLISAIIRLLAPNAQISQGSIRFKGQDLLGLSPEAMRKLRGDEISMVFQDPMTSLNPVLTIGRQMADVQHRSPVGRKAKNARSLMMLERVGIPDPTSQLDRYPHQLSGGMRQRVAIAMALMAEPSLLIADEPTTALDATLEVQIIHRLQQLQADFGCSILFIGGCWQCGVREINVADGRRCAAVYHFQRMQEAGSQEDPQRETLCPRATTFDRATCPMDLSR